MKDRIKIEILNLLKSNTDYTVPEIVNELNKTGLEVKGDRWLYIEENCVIWINLSSDFNNAISELQAEKKIIMNRLSEVKAKMIYSINGELLHFPFAETIRKYKEPHWCPIIIKSII